MRKHRFTEILIDDIRYFVLPEGLLPLEIIQTLEGLIALRQVGFNNLNGAIYAMPEKTMREILASEQQE